MPVERPPRLAVLIDADNASAKIADGLFNEIATLGEASVRRIYGDIASPRLRGWADILTRYAIDWRQQTAYTVGKNASDITLVIEAMDLLHTGRFEGFCHVSSDSDFTPHPSRIREEGIDVFGFGEQKTPESFKQACKRFIFTENLLPRAAEATSKPAALEPPTNAEKLVKQAIGELDGEDGWVGLGQIGTQLGNLRSDFDPRTYGFKKLSDLVRSLGGLEVRREGGQVLVRVVAASTKPPRARKR